MSKEACLQFSQKAVYRLCERLSEEIGSLWFYPWMVVLISLLSVATYLVLMVKGMSWVQGQLNAIDSQRQSIYAAQDAAVKLRAKWAAHIEWKRRGPDRPDQCSQVELEDYLIRFRDLAANIKDSEVRSAFASWCAYAEEFYSGDAGSDAHVEGQHWHDAIETSGRAVRKLMA